MRVYPVTSLSYVAAAVYINQERIITTEETATFTLGQEKKCKVPSASFILKGPVPWIGRVGL